MTRPARAPLRALCIAALGLMALAPATVGSQDLPIIGTDSVRQGDEASVRRTLFRLEDDFARAVVHRDARALHRLVSRRWVYSDESGVMEREAGIRAFTTGTDTVRQASNSDMRAFIYHGAAAVIGVLHLSGSGPGGPFIRQYRYTDSWALIDGRWQCIASQDYLMPETKPAR